MGTERPVLTGEKRKSVVVEVDDDRGVMMNEVRDLERLLKRRTMEENARDTQQWQPGRKIHTFNTG